ncbi:MAG: hypothetical protein VB064_13210, partial [Oscillospiraceae bacterium]|nr:hypothetical protein [Oscillospiraceae bacterium]
MRKKIIMAVLSILLIALIIYNQGFAFNPLTAAERNQYVSADAKVISQAVIGNQYLFVFEKDEEYQAIIVQKHLVLWKSNNWSFHSKKSSDLIRLISYCGVSLDDHTGITAVFIQNFDDNVSFVKIGTGSDEQEKNVVPGEIIVFTLSKLIDFKDLNAIAYSNELSPLYKLDNKIKDGAI